MDFRQYVRSHLPPLLIHREPEIVDELAQHLTDLYEEGRAGGLDHDAAFARAAAALPQSADALAREIRTASRALPALIVDRWRASLNEPPPAASGRFTMLNDLRGDVRYSLRTLLRTPGFALVVCLTIALGVGANALIFSAVDAILLRSAPVADPDALVSVYTTSGPQQYSTSSYPDFQDLRASGAFADLAAFAPIQLALDAAGETHALNGEVVSGNYFDLLGVRFALGRGFAPDEDRVGAPVRVAVISYALWQRHFGRDGSLVGRTIALNGNSYTVIGIAPRSFSSPIVGRTADVWVPMALQPEVRPPSAGLRRQIGSSQLLGARGLRWIDLIGRLRSGSRTSEAAAAADVIASQLSTAHSDSNRDRRFTVVPLGEGPGVRVSTRPMLYLLLGAVTLVLLIACANVASLLLARAVSRRREVAVRMAVGAGRARLVRQWFTESVLLALLGAAAGVAIAWWGTPLLHLVGIPETVALGVNVRVFAYSLAIAIASGVLFGLAPIVQTLRRDTISALRDEGGAVATGARATRMRSTFVVLQVAMSLMLLVGAGLFLRTLRNAYEVDLGYQVDATLLTDINLDVRGYSQQAGLAAYEQILSRIEAIPGVAAAGAARVTVLSGGARTTTMNTQGQFVNDGEPDSFNVRVNVVSHRYLDALGIPVLRGRLFDSSDKAGTPRVIIATDSLVRRLWPNEDPIGKTIGQGANVLQVIGVVPDTVYRSALERDAPPYFYALLAQSYESGVTLHVRAVSGDPLALLPAVRNAVRNVDPQLVASRPRLLRDEFTRSIADQRMMAILIGLFGAIALTLAAVGLYGVMSHLAGQRTTEIGIRLALGAEPVSILRLILLQGLKLVGIGAAIGLAGAFAAMRYLETRLFGVEPTDPATFAGVCAVLGAVGVLACFVPARRAMRVEPAVALRNA